MNKEHVAFLLISLVFLIVFGGLISILPSRRARQIGNLRILARRYDLEISLVQIPDVNASLTDRVTAGGIRLDPQKRCVAWSKRYTDPCSELPVWIDYVSTSPEFEAVRWHRLDSGQSTNLLTDSYWREVSRIKIGLPSRCVAIECTPTEVRWLGYEVIDSTAEEFIQRMVQSIDELLELNVSTVKEQVKSKEQHESATDPR